MGEAARRALSPPAPSHNVKGMPELEQADLSAPLGADIFCPVCGYSLQAAPSDRCPECGHSLDNLRSGECGIPWTQRPAKDRYLAYWKTVWLVTFRPILFCEEYAHVLRLRDARLFQLVTVVHAYLPVLVATLVLYATTPFQPEVDSPVQQRMTTGVVVSGPTFIDRAYAEVWPVVMLHACFIPFLFAATGVPGCFFRPRTVAQQQRDNAVALSLYACAPLAWLPAIVLVGLMLSAIVAHDGAGYGRAWAPWLGSPGFFGIGLLFPGGVCVFAWWLGLLRLVQRTMPLRKRRHAVLACGLPFIWFGLAFLFLCFVPLLVVYVLVVIVSLSV